MRRPVTWDSPLDVTRLNVARVSDYLLGDHDNFRVARELVQLYAPLPGLLRDKRALVGRVVRWAASEWDTRTLTSRGCPYPAHRGAVAYVGHIGSTAVRNGHVAR
jgi:hypothetical protein